MPVAPNALERLVLLRLNRGPGPVLDLVGGASERAVGLALEMGVFDALADKPATLPELAEWVDCAPEGLDPLLGFLVALGYLSRDGDDYANTAMTRAWLLDDPESVAPWLRFWDEVAFPFWDEHLETAVRTGNPPQTLYEWLDDHPEHWRVTHEGFRAAAAVLAPAVIGKLDLPEGARVLDVGGGHGLYAAELAAENPDATVTVFDSEHAREVATETAEQAGAGYRIAFEAGDYTTDPLDSDGEGYDVALLFNVVHAHDGAETTALLERVHEALRPGGTLYVLDQFEGTARTALGRATVGFVGLTYLVTLGQRAHTVDDVEDWLEEAGFTVEGRESFLTAPGLSLFVAERTN
ncbi:methyltransferase [Halorarius litoreus]|uniref:methyltransferase n=1 Tax=Halorarius litoreus TaxID=2962676 RepID=UPI0020CF43CF|nr:methyltransferase [Halorarius litoreus]